MLRICIVFTALIAFASTSIAGKLYKWKDANGKVHYSDSPVKVPKKKLNSMKVESTAYRKFRGRVPNLSLDELRKMLSKGKSWDQIINPTPVMPGTCLPFDNPQFGTTPETAPNKELVEFCLGEKKSRRDYEYARLDKKAAFHESLVKRRAAKPEVLEEVLKKMDDVDREYYRYEDRMMELLKNSTQ